MAFQHSNEFVTGSANPSFASHLHSSSNAAENKKTIISSAGPFATMTQDWHETGVDGKHDDESMTGMGTTSSSTIDSQFKHETAWSPNDPLTNLNHHAEFDAPISEYTVHGASAPIGISYDPGAQSNAGSSASAAGSNVMGSMQGPSQFAMSPQGQPWVSTPVTDGFDFSPLAPQGARSTPVFATSTSILRRDGIRKKNARFEIPAERNLRTIDQLIAQTTDEGEIKELKQQKRLLRNRQAALDSRQRKKQHTERLEEEKKQYTTILSEMDDELNTMKMREAEWIRQRDEILQTNARLHQWCQQLQAEKDESVRAHTVEAGQLRKENSMLLEQLQRVDAANLSAPASAGLPAEFSEFDQLTIQNHPWEHFPLANSFGIEPHTGPENAVNHLPPKQSVSAAKEEKDHTSTLAFMLLLLGAWFVSRGTVADANLLPSVPESLRVASNTVIEGLYRDSGVALPDHDSMPISDDLEKDVIHVSSQPSSELPGAQLVHRISPGDCTDSQSSQMHMDDDIFDHGSTPRNLGSLSSDVSHMNQIMRDAVRSTGATGGSAHPSTSEPYIRSILIDKIPPQVLRDFASMVARSRRSSEMGPRANDDQHSYD